MGMGWADGFFFVCMTGGLQLDCACLACLLYSNAVVDSKKNVTIAMSFPPPFVGWPLAPRTSFVVRIEMKKRSEIRTRTETKTVAPAAADGRHSYLPFRMHHNPASFCWPPWKWCLPRSLHVVACSCAYASSLPLWVPRCDPASRRVSRPSPRTRPADFRPKWAAPF